MKKRGKKGISPLIATVILIGFVIAIAAIVMLWGKGFITETAEKEGELAQAKLACNNVDIKITYTNGIYYIENIGTETIDSFVIRGGSSDPREETVRLAPMGYIEIDLGSNDEIIPRIRPPGAGAPAIPCSNAAKTIIQGG